MRPTAAAALSISACQHVISTIHCRYRVAITNQRRQPYQRRYQHTIFISTSFVR